MDLRRKQRIDYSLGGFLILLLRPLVLLLGKLLHRDHALRVEREVCIQKLLGGGSLVLAFPALLGLRLRHADVRLSLLCTPSVVPFAETLRVFDRLIVIDDASLGRLARSSLRALRVCFRVDTVVDLEVYSRLSTVFSALTCARNRLGFYLQDMFWRRGLHTHLAFFNRFAGSYYFYEKLVELLGAPPATPAACREHLLAALPATQRGGRATICIGAGCSELAPERMLSSGQWEKVFLLRARRAEPVRFVFLGAASDRALAQGIVRAAQGHFPEHRFENRCGELDLPRSLAELAGAAEFWGIDSALLHYARLFGVRCLSFWGPTDPQTRLKPIEGLEEEVVYRKIPCSPCVHLSETAPCHGNNVCIQNLFEPESDRDPRWSPYVGA